MALLPGGGNAEFVAVRSAHTMPIPKGLSCVDAAAIPEVWLTAYQLLRRIAQINTGESVLIHAGASGVGTAAVQLVTKMYNGTVYATAGSEEKCRFVNQLGAQHVVNYNKENFAQTVTKNTAGKGVDVILDCIGSKYWEKNLQSLATGGRWVLYGLLSGGEIHGNFLDQIIRRRIRLEGTTLRARPAEVKKGFLAKPYKSSLIADFAQEILPHFETGLLTAVVDSSLPLGRIADAHRRIEENKNIGKIVLLVQNETVPVSPTSAE